MKKLFTLIALFALVSLGAQAGKKIVDYTIDYSTWEKWDQYKMGFKPQIRDGVLWSNPAHAWDGDADDYAAEPASWYQFFMSNAFSGEDGTNYTVTLTMRGSEPGSFNLNLRWSWSEDAINANGNFSTEWEDVVLEYADPVNGTNIDLIFQSSFQGDIEIAKVVVSHEEDENAQPIEWINHLVNGDAEADWADPALSDQADNVNEVCAWGKEYMGRDASNGNAEIAHPHPATIVTEADGNRVFVVKTVAVDPNEFADFFIDADGNVKGDPEWQNQFWIESPKAWKSGETVKISFRYKASASAKIGTQCHNKTPGSYMHWAAIGDIEFTEDWQTFDRQWTIPSEGDGMYSIAFNLGANKAWQQNIDYYFDDLKWEEMKLEEGYFVAGANPAEGIAYDYDKSITMEWNDDEAYYEATVGSAEEPVSEIMVATKRGNAKAFQANTLKLARSISYVDGSDYIDYEAKAKSVIKLPGSGVWNVYLDPDLKQIAVEAIDVKLFVKVKITPNSYENIVEGVERDWKAEGEEEVGAGQPWDNQFWILANRPLKAGEETYLEFEYKGSVDAKTTTQCHGDIANGGNYMHWQAIGDVNFTTDWQTAKINFTVPEAADGMQSIAFNMAEIKGACNYEIKNVIWALGYNEETNEADESLIDFTGDKNFWKKVGAGTAPFNVSGITTVTFDTKVNGSIFNLAGQKVNNDYKGIVIKNGQKVMVK